jgi:hypothetical protein
MIDWYNLVSNSFWIIGLATALATISFASWQASINHEKFKVVIGQPPIQVALNLAGVLFCIGLALTSTKTYEIILWSILAAAFGVWVILSWIQKSRGRQTQKDN